MKKIIVLLFLSYCMLSCDSENVEPSNTRKNLIKELNIGDTKFVFEYDSEGRVSHIKETYVFEGDYYYTSGTDEYEFSYETNKITITNTYSWTDITNGESDSDEGVINRDLFLKDGKISKIIYSDGDYETISSLEYDENGNLALWTESLDYYQYFWDNKNVVSAERYYLGVNGRIKKSPFLHQRTFNSSNNARMKEGQKEAEYTYSSYDNKSNPLKVLNYIYPEEVFFLSANNVGKVTEKHLDDNPISIITIDFTYKYNEQGYPTEATVVYDSDEGVETDQWIIKYY